MIFDIRSELTCKACFITGGHETDTPEESIYSSVVTCSSVCIALMIATLNDLNVLSANMQNAYISSPTKEKVYTTVGLEFGKENMQRPILIIGNCMV